MFTGIIEEIGRVKSTGYKDNMLRIEIECKKVLSDVKKGDSIAVNGICLTVSDYGNEYFMSDIMDETAKRAEVNLIKSGDNVNLERALKLSDRLGGHIVSGHIDGTGEVLEIDNKNNVVWYTILANNFIMNYIVEKGSVALDGISLTVAYCNENSFKVSLIPETIESTIIRYKKKGDRINIECDIIGKYIEKFVSNKNIKNFDKGKITLEFLKDNGF